VKHFFYRNFMRKSQLKQT